MYALLFQFFKWKCTNWGKEALISKFVMKHPMNAITHRYPTEKKKYLPVLLEAVTYDWLIKTFFQFGIISWRVLLCWYYFINEFWCSLFYFVLPDNICTFCSLVSKLYSCTWFKLTAPATDYTPLSIHLLKKNIVTSTLWCW